MADAHESPETPFPIAPSPWDDLKADVFSTVGWASVSNGLPAGSFGPLEQNSSFSDPEASGKFKGGLCSIMILRYYQTPFGPYDEVIWIPGSFEVPHLDRNEMGCHFRDLISITYELPGRRNWNIPKQVANFTFHPSDTPNPPYKKIDVALPETPDKPFVSVDLTPITLLSRPTIPVSTTYLPLNMDLAMPPLPESENWKEDGQVGTEKWHAARATISGWSGMVRVTGKIGNRDGEGFPALDMGGTWFWMKDAKVMFERVDEDYEL